MHCDDGAVCVVGADFVRAMEAYLLVYVRKETADVPLLTRPRDFRRPQDDAGYVDAFAECWRGLGDAVVLGPGPRPIAAAGPIDVADDGVGEARPVRRAL